MTRRFASRARYLSIAVLALLVVPVLAHTEASEPPPEGTYSEVHNSGVLDASTLWGTVLAGQEINGTIGHLYIRNLPLDDYYSLVAPDGTVVGPVPAYGGEAVFDFVPLYITGDWKVVSALLGTTVSQFEVVLASWSGPIGLSTYVVDVAIHLAANKNYGPGLAAVYIAGPYCEWTTDKFPAGYGYGTSVRVAIPWRATFGDVGRYARFYMTTDSDGVGRPGVTTVYTTGLNEGMLSVYASWKSGSAYKVTFGAQDSKNGASTHCQDVVRPQF